MSRGERNTKASPPGWLHTITSRRGNCTWAKKYGEWVQRECMRSDSGTHSKLFIFKKKEKLAEWGRHSPIRCLWTICFSVSRSNVVSFIKSFFIGFLHELYPESMLQWTIDQFIHINATTSLLEYEHIFDIYLKPSIVYFHKDRIPFDRNSNNYVTMHNYWIVRMKRIFVKTSLRFQSFD